MTYVVLDDDLRCRRWRVRVRRILFFFCYHKPETLRKFANYYYYRRRFTAMVSLLFSALTTLLSRAPAFRRIFGSLTNSFEPTENFVFSEPNNDVWRTKTFTVLAEFLKLTSSLRRLFVKVFRLITDYCRLTDRKSLMRPRTGKKINF